MQSKSNYFFISFFLSITILLSGCAVGVLGGPTSYADRRTTESQITDEKLEWQTVLKTQDIEGEFRANFVSYNQVVLITGQAPNQEIIDKIVNTVSNMESVKKAENYMQALITEINHIGVLTLELFDSDDDLIVNEIAPRVHNSGHLTINAYNISQFENHVRAVCSLEKVPLKKLSNAEMINLIGSQIEPYRQNFNLKENEFFFDYLKKEIKEKRKMGHITTLI